MIKLLIAASVIAVAIAASALSGLLDIRASSPHSGIVSWYLSTAARASIKRQARNVTVPNLGDEALVLAGINDYESMCVDCHGAPGKDPGPIGQGLNPPAPELAQSARRMSAAELFWVTKHGIRMTGMPAWGASHDDDALWPVIAFTTRLPELDASGYQGLLVAAAGHGHHAAGPAGVEDENTAGENPPAGQVHVHDDGSNHLHDGPAAPKSAEEEEHGTHEH